MSRHPTAATLKVSALIVVLLALSGVLLAGSWGQRSHASQLLTVPWWLLTALFALSELIVLHIQVRREAQSISLSEIPLLLGLFFASSRVLLLSCVLGGAVVLLFHRRQAALKLIFNLSQMAAQVCVASTMFALLRPGSQTVGWKVCLAAYVSVGISSVVSGLATTLVIALSEGELRPFDLLREAATAALSSVAVVSVGLVAVYALSANASAAGPLTVCGFVLLVAYRAYATLSDRHLSLDRLHQFSQSITGAADVDEVLSAVLQQAKDILKADWAEVTVLASRADQAGRRTTVHVALDSAGQLIRSTSAPDDPRNPLHAAVARSGAPVLVSGQSHDERQVDFLRLHRFRDAMIAPLAGDGRMLGTLTVADRLGDVRRFDNADLTLLETVANHASVALKNGQLIDQLRHESLHDVLTGLPNREMLRQNLQESLQRLGSPAVPAVTVLLADLDRFKDVNDTMGHRSGDQLLIEVGRRLQVAAGPRATVARLGGDEFAILLQGPSTSAEATVIVKQLLRSLDEPVQVDGVAVKVRASTGIARAPEDSRDATELLRCADVAMYSAKRAGAGYRRYRRSMDTNSFERLQLLGELRAAIDNDQLVIHVQPKADVASGEIVGVEALVRWQHPERGILPPDTFIDLAEHNGLMPALTRTVLEQATRAAGQWHHTGEHLHIAVNVSPHSLTSGDLVAQVTDALHHSQLPPELLTLEITESTLMSDLTSATALLVELNGLGVRISVDDFGTGYSSLSYLKRLPVQEMKVDQSFVMNMATDLEDQVIARTIVGLGASLGLSVVAEGVEDQTSWDLLRDMGCPLLQGYHLSRPMPVEQFPAWLNHYRAGRDPQPSASLDHVITSRTTSEDTSDSAASKLSLLNS